MLCKFIYERKLISYIISYRFTKARKRCAWADDHREKLCQKLRKKRQLITIFNFDSPEHHGKLEEAILEALFKG